MIILYGILSISSFYFLKSHPDYVSHFHYFTSISIAFVLITLGLGLFILGIFQFSNFRHYSLKYIKDYRNNSEHHDYPPFLRDIFVKRIKWRYYTILIFSITYTFGLVIIPILYLIKHYEGVDFSIAWWNIGQTPNVNYVINIFWGILIIVTLFSFINILINEKRHSILSMYSSDNVLTKEDKQKIIKKTKTKCLIIYLIFLCILIIFFIFLFFIFFKKKKNIKISK